MKLYVCWGSFASPWGHPCNTAHRALVNAGYQPEVVKCYGSAMLPAAFNRTAGRRAVKRLTGELSVPLLVTDTGETITQTERIVEWAAAHPVSPRATRA